MYMFTTVWTQVKYFHKYAIIFVVHVAVCYPLVTNYLMAGEILSIMAHYEGMHIHMYAL